MSKLSRTMRTFCYCGTHALAVLSVLVGLQACEPSRPPASNNTGIRFLVQGDEHSEFARASQPHLFEFPRDHGAHPQFRTEWWYFTGNLETESGRHFGFELTFFRYGLSAAIPVGESRWRTNQAWLAHFAVTDTKNNTFYAYERLARNALGIAGAQTDQLGVQVENWYARSETSNEPGGASIALAANAEGTAIELRLQPQRGPVLQGDGGLDPKGPEPGNASYYYSLPRLSVSGNISLPNEEGLAVKGWAWLDREWGTSALSERVTGWDWLSLQLSDGRDLMFYRLRNDDGTANEYSGGSVSSADGQVTRLSREDVNMQIMRQWRSPISNIQYPVDWRVSIESLGIDLLVEPRQDNQELNLGLRYWEGAVTASSVETSASLTGIGYLELAGYND